MSLIRFTESTVPTDNPPAGKFYCGVDSADSKFYIKDSAGTVVKYANESGVQQSKLDATTAPGATNDNTEGYAVGSLWINVTGDEAYRCVDATTSAAVWINTTLETGELHSVALSGDYTELINKPTTITAQQATDITTNNAKITYPAADSSKLAGIEAGATADQTGAEIKTAYEAEANTNAFTDTEQTKLTGIATGAQVNPDVVPQAEAEAGTATTERIWTAQRVKQAIDALASSTWQPPAINFGNGYTAGVSVFRSTGSGLLFTFDAASDDEWSANIPLDNNGIAYDGSNLKVRISYQIPVAGGGTDDIKLNYDYAFIKNGDNADLDKTEFTDTLDVSALAATSVTSYDSATLTGEAGATGLQISIERNSTGAGADSYGNDFDIIFIELIKA